MAKTRHNLGEPYLTDHTADHGAWTTAWTTLDSVCAYAALSIMPEPAGVLTVEFKVNLLATMTGYDDVSRLGKAFRVEPSGDAHHGQKRR